LLSDTFLGNSSEPWPIPEVDSLPTIDPHFATGPNAGQEFLPYLRDERLARPWAVPGTPGLRHRIGGLEKEDGTGDISYDALNHERMTHLRAEKVAKVADSVPPLEVDDPDGDAELLVLGWGSTFGTIRASARRLREQGRKVATAHLVHLNPFPRNTEEVVRRYPKVLIPEVNLGQLSLLIRGRFLVDARSFTKMQGLPIHLDELEAEMTKVMDE
jgi:2-oxoglutarate ferredoxin oxidoreductase subunit alpha